MPRNGNPSQCLLGLVILLGISSAMRADDQSAWRSVVQSINLLPHAAALPDGAAGRKTNPRGQVAYWEKTAGRPQTADERALLDRGAEGPWKLFSDDLVQFEIPDDPLLTVESLVPADNPRLTVVGGVVSSADNSFQRAYRITFGDGQPYATILVAENNWFDEGLCFCGPIRLKSFALAGGQLYEFSQMPHGWIKKIQVLNDTHRAILFEWTHSVMTHDAYVRIGASLRFRQPSRRTREEWILWAKGKRGFEAGINWLHAGMPVDEIEELLGPPLHQREDELIYVREARDETGRGERTTIRLPIREGRLTVLDDNWRTEETLEAPRGSLAWIEDELSKWFSQWDEHSPERDESKRPSLPSDDVKIMLDAFHTHAPSAQGEAWSAWCQVIADLAALGVTDRTAADVVVKRCAEGNLPQGAAFSVLDLYQSPEELKLVRRRLRLLLSDSEVAEQYRSECENLFTELQQGDEESEELIRRGAVHDVEEIRAVASHVLHKLPREEARRLLRQRLSDPISAVRSHAISCIRELCTPDDAVWLQERVQHEDDRGNRKWLERAINGLE